MSAIAMPAMGAVALTSANIVTPAEGGDSYLNVGTNNNDGTIWKGDLTIGDSDEATGDVDNVGAFDTNWEWVKPGDNVFINHLKVEGNITLQGEGEVVLGGMFSDTNYKGIEATGSITVNGGSLKATKIIANDLVVTGGTVSTHTDGCKKGVHSTNVAAPNLQSFIKNSLTISGGELSFGYAGEDIAGVGGNGSRMTTFGDMTTGAIIIKQTGGTMNVYGDMGLKDGSTITQEENAGLMMLRDTVWMDFSGTTTFNQSANSATLIIGRLESAKTNNVHDIVFNQGGAGVIHLAYGSNFAKESTISLNQTGSGVINIGGGHDTNLTGALPTSRDYSLTSFESINTTYNIKQTGTGTINVNGELSADVVSISGESKLNLNENVTVNSLTQSDAGKTTVAEGKTLTVGDVTIDGGVFENKGTITGAVPQAIVTISGGEFINSGTTNSSILVDGGTLSLNTGMLADVTMNSGSIVVGTNTTIGSLTLNGGDISGDLSGCKLKTAGDVKVDVTVTDAAIIATGGEISGAISGTSTVEVTGGTTLLSGENNDYSGGTKVNGGELAVGSDKALGSGKVSLVDGALNLGSQAVSNDIEAASGVIRGADKYDGNLVVSDDLTIEGSVTAKSITMLNNASIVLQEAATYSRRSTPAAAVARTDAMYVYTEGDGHFTGSLTLNDGGLIELKNGNSLVVTGTLTLGNGTKLVLNGDYAAGDTLVSATETLTLGEVTLVYDDNTVVMEQQGNSLVLVGNFKQEKAIACTLTNWGIATASRAVVNAVRGQRSNTGCIANGAGTAWVAVLGGNHDINGSDINLSGAALGADMQVGAASRVGIALGYVEGEVQPTGLRQVDQEGSYIAAYGEHGLKKLSSTSCLSMDWVAAYGVTDSEVAGLKWEQDSLQLNSRVNWNKKVTDKLCMSVFGGLEYFANNSDTVDGVKTGSIQNLRGEIGVGARYVAWGTPAVSDSKSGLVLAQGCEKLVLNGEVRYMNDMVRSNPVIRMNGLSGMGENPGRQGMGIEAGATYRIGERWSASANYGFNTMEDSKEHRVNVGASYTF